MLGLSNAMFPVIDDALASLEEDRPMRCTVADALAVHIILDAVRLSLTKGGWVDVSEMHVSETTVSDAGARLS
jgi:hypothetical protein